VNIFESLLVIVKGNGDGMRAYLRLAIGAAFAAGCLRPHPSEVVVYTAHDREFSEPILDAFTQQTGIRVLAKYDTESTKTVGLTNAILAEANRPRCDVFWNNEILNTIRLERHGLLAAYRPPLSKQIPEKYRSPNGRWHGFAARARVLIVNTQLVDESEKPQSILELADPKWKDRVAIAKPLFGTTATHAALLFARWPRSGAEEYWQAVLANAQVLSGNKQVAQAVASGQLAWGLTDTDDAICEVDGGFPVEIVFPDQGNDGLGTPLIPNTVGMIQGCRHRTEAERLIAYLISPEVESQLAVGRSAQIPLLSSTLTKSRLALPVSLKDFSVSFYEAAEQWNVAVAFLRQQYIGDRP
jgi:iron(III) transport system substrate-binding protein